MRYARTIRALMSLCLVLSLQIAFAVSVCVGQDPKPADAPAAYTTIKPSGEFANPKSAKEMATKKREMLKGNVDFDADLVKSYYNKYIFPKMTFVEQINSARTEIFADLAEVYKDGRKPEIRKTYLTLLTTIMKEGIKKEKNYHPSTRVNCLLVLGQLDSTPGVKTTKLPVPLAEVRDILMAEFGKPDNDGMIGAALVGMERHARLSAQTWDEPTKAKVHETIHQWITAEKPVSRADDVQSYFQRKGLEIVSYIDTPEFAKTRNFMLDTVKNHDAEVFLRAHCIRAIAKQNLLEGTDVEEVAKVSGGVAQFVRHEVESWMDRVSRQSDKAGAGGMFGGGMGPGLGGGAPGVGGGSAGIDGGGGGGYGGAGGNRGAGGDKKEDPIDIQSAEVKIARRYLNTILEYSHTGLNGLPSTKKSASVETKFGIYGALGDHDALRPTRKLIERIDAIQKELNGEDIKDIESLRKKIAPSVGKLMKDKEIRALANAGPTTGTEGGPDEAAKDEDSKEGEAGAE